MTPRQLRRRILAGLIAVLFPVLFYASGPPPGIEVSGLGHKVLSGPDDDGDLEISVKLTVKNTTDADITVEIRVQAIDAEDFEVFEVRLSGTVKAKQTRVLTDSQFIQQKLYKTIAKWQVED